MNSIQLLGVNSLRYNIVLSRKLKNLLAMSKCIGWSFLINVICASILMPRKLRFYIYRAFGVNTQSPYIDSRCFFRTSNNIEIGKNTFINTGCFIENNALIKIGENCDIAMEVLIGSDTHEDGTAEKRAGKVKSLPIVIGNGCWIGARSTILAGVSIGEGCVIAAGSVVTKDCEPHGLYAGVPAKRKKDLYI